MEDSKLSLDLVENLSEIWDGFSLMDKHQVSKENCQSLEEMKERLRLHYYREMGQSRSLETAQDVITTIRKTDEEKRMQLKALLSETLTSLDGLDDHVISHLVQEGTLTDGAMQDFDRHVQALVHNECPILVAGETSSGKSSLLNLLLGREVLPRRLLSCTSTICKLRYGPTLRVRCHGDDGQVEEKELLPDADPAEQLAEYIFKETDRDDTSFYKSVEIFIPLELLKTGVYIIDSPGFGENSTMDKVLMEYIANNDIFAFIYVIKSDNAGGVQEDRLQRILKHIVERQRHVSFSHFDPRAAIFVCNRWDLVPDEEKEAVLDDTFLKLSRSWPELDKSQIFPMATLKALATKEAGYVSDDYSRLLDGIQKLIPTGLQRRLEHSYRWLEHFLLRLLHQVSSYLAKTRMSAKELHCRQKATEFRLHKVERESVVIMKKLEKQLDKSVHSVARKLSEHLKQDDARVKMTTWSMDELPPITEDDLWVDMEPELDNKIERKLAYLLKDWDESERFFQKVQVELLASFKDDFLVLESQLNSIEQFIQSDDLSLSEKSDEETTKYLSIADNIDTSDSLFDFNFSTMQKIAIGMAAPVLVPVAMGLLVGAPVFLLWDFKKWRRRSIAQKNLQNYIDDPLNFIRKRSENILSKVCVLENVTEYVYNQMEPARMYLEAMRMAVPKLVESNRVLIDSIVEDKRTRQELEERYLEYETLIPRLQDKLAAYGNINIREYEFTADDIEILTATTVMNKPIRTVGIWSESRHGIITLDIERLKKQAVTIKSYRRQVSPLHLIMEEVHFKKARHPQIARLLGTFEETRGVPGFILDQTLVSARRELFGFRALPRASRGRNVLMERSRQILEQVGIGLEYLHYRGLVHMELSLDTVMMVANKDQIKLTNVGEPRKACVADLLEGETGSFVYLPPEVLRGGIYRARADMYGIGLMAWELWSQDEAFKQQRKIKLKDFIDQVSPDGLKMDGENPFVTLLEVCVTSQAEERLCSTTWVNEIRKVDLLHKMKWLEDEDK